MVQTQTTTLHCLFLYTVFQPLLFVWFSTSACCKKAGFELHFLKTCYAEKKPKRAIPFHFSSSKTATPLLCRVLFPVPLQGISQPQEGM